MNSERRDEADFTAFFETEFPSQVRRAAMMLHDLETAQDVVHEAFLQVWRRWDQVDEPGPYLNRCVLNGCRDHASRGRRARSIPVAAASGSGYERHAFAELHDVLLRLPFNPRAAAVLKYYGGFTNDEIAGILGCRVGSIGPWIQRAKKQLLKELT